MHKNIIVMWNFFVHNNDLLPTVHQCIQYNRFIVDCICAKHEKLVKRKKECKNSLDIYNIICYNRYIKGRQKATAKSPIDKLNN